MLYNGFMARFRFPRFRLPRWTPYIAYIFLVFAILAGIFVFKYGTPGFFRAETKGNNPVIYLPFEETNGTTVTTIGATKIPFTLTNGATIKVGSECYSGNCVDLDGINDYVWVDESMQGGLNPSDDPFTIQSWFRHDIEISGMDTLVSRYQFSGYRIYMNSTGNMCFYIEDTVGTSDTLCTTKSYNDSQWHQIHAIKTATQLQIYIDGLLEASSTFTATGDIGVSETSYFIGINNDSGSDFWNGYIDEFKYYNYARSVEQIKTDTFASGTPVGVAAQVGTPPSLGNGLVLWWKLTDATANSCSGGVNDACDSSGNGHDGEWFGNATSARDSRFGYRVDLDGTGDYVYSDHLLSGVLDFDQTESFTYSIWVYPTSVSGNRVIFSKGNPLTPEQGFTFMLTGNALSAELSDGVNNASLNMGTATVNTWVHLIGIVDRKNKVFYAYANGTLVAQADISSMGSVSNSEGIFVGADSTGGANLAGRVADARIYNRALSSAEIDKLYTYRPGPVAWYKMDENTGTTTIYDSSGNNRHGTMNGSMTNSDWVPSRKSSGLNFDGSNDYIELPTGFLDTVTGSASMWVRAVNSYSAFGTLFYATDATTGSRDGNGSELEFHLNFDTGGVLKLYFEESPTGGVDDTEIITTGRDYTDDTWHYVTATWDTEANTSAIYVDGHPIVFGAHSVGTPYGSAVAIRLGRVFASSRYYTGDMDDVKFYNYAITQEQIFRDMNSGTTLTKTNPARTAATWSFDEGIGTTANDKSGLFNHLTLNSSSWTNTGYLNGAFYANGSTWASRSDDINLNFHANQPFTISLWAKSASATNPATNQYLIDKASPSEPTTYTPGYNIYFTTNGGIACGVDDDTSWTSGIAEKVASTSTDYYDANWHHIMCVREGTDLRLYVDGTLVQTTTNATGTGSLVNADHFTVGSRNLADDTDDFVGYIDEVKVYNYVETLTNVQAVTNSNYSLALGTYSTQSDGITNTNATDRTYCVPGDTTTCNPPIGHWTFDENTGTLAKDTSANANTGTLTNGPVWTDGKVGQALQFDGSNDHVVLPTSSSLNITGDISLESWIKTSSTGFPHIFGGYQSSSPYPGYAIALGANADPGKFCFWNGTGWNCTTTNVNDGKWHHVAAVLSGSTLYLYIDGIINRTVTSVATIPSYTSTRVIGGRSDANVTYIWNGKLDDVRLYNYARTHAQVQWDYNKGGPLAHWKLDECTGTTANDATGNAQTGTITIGATGTYTSAGTCNSGNSAHAWNAGTGGKFNGSLGFDRTDDFITVNNSSYISPPREISFGHWMKTSTTNIVSINKQNVNAVSDSYQLYINTSGILRTTVDGVTATGTKVVTDGNWHHVMTTYDGSTIRLYLDGRLEASTNYSTSAITYSSINLFIGKNNSGSFNFNGLLDDVRIYGYALSPKQIQLIMNENAAVRYAPISGSP